MSNDTDALGSSWILNFVSENSLNQPVLSGNSSKGQASENQSIANRDLSSIYQEQKVQPCHLSSSIYYGGQDVYSHPESSQGFGLNSVVSTSSCPVGMKYLVSSDWKDIRGIIFAYKFGIL